MKWILTGFLEFTGLFFYFEKQSGTHLLISPSRVSSRGAHKTILLVAAMMCEVDRVIPCAMTTRRAERPFLK